MQIIKQVSIGRKGEGARQATVVRADSGNHYLVSSVMWDLVDETLVFRSDESGKVTSWSDVYGVRPCNHDDVLDDLVSGRVTEEDFYTEG